MGWGRNDIDYKKREEKLIKYFNRNNNSKNKKHVTLKDGINSRVDKNLSLIVEEFIKFNDINIVSENIGIPAFQIKKWYRCGKRGNNKYRGFYNILTELNPNMNIK